MSNLEIAPPVLERGGSEGVSAAPVHELIRGHVTSLGNGTDVRRVLPTLGRRMVGAWCFFDHYGPDDVRTAAGMQVPPHPHTGLQTVSWLLEGTVRHRDSLGHDLTVAPGQLGLMTSGRGIAHSEQSPVPHPALLHGAQLWVALPDSVRHTSPSFDHHPVLPTVEYGGARIRVVLSEFDGVRSPGTVYSPLVGLDAAVGAETAAALPLEPDFEYAAVTVAGSPTVDGEQLPIGSLLYLGAGRRSVSLSGPGRVMILGGEPFAERIVMWWNLIGRSHDEIATLRQEWNDGADRFGDRAAFDAVGWTAEAGAPTAGEPAGRAPAPNLPPGRLRPRGTV